MDVLAALGDFLSRAWHWFLIFVLVAAVFEIGRCTYRLAVHGMPERTDTLQMDEAEQSRALDRHEIL